MSDDERWILEVLTESLPHRVVLYWYPTVDSDGIPDEVLGEEVICTVKNPICEVVAAAGGFAVRSTGGQGTGYFVVQAAWLGSAGGPGEFQVSWSFGVSVL